MNNASSASRLVVLAQNAGANLAKIASSGLATLLLPVVLLITLTPHSYAAWSLVFSVALYMQYLDLGVPTSVQAVVGRQHPQEHHGRALRTVSAGVAITSACAAVALVAALAVSPALGSLFPDMPSDLVVPAGRALVLLVAGQAANLVSNTASSYYAGMLRTGVSARILVPARLGSLVAACGTSVLSSNLELIATAFAAPLVLGALVLVGSIWSDSRREERDQVTRVADEPAGLVSTSVDLVKYSGPLILWNLCMLAITGVGVALVARFDFAHVVDYSIAMIVVAAINGVFGGAMAPLLPEFARLVATSGTERAVRVAMRTTRLAGVVLAATAALAVALLALLALGPLDSSLSDGAPLVFALTFVATAARQTVSPLSLLFIAAKVHHRIIAPPVIEAAATAASCLALGNLWGVRGVALGVFIGAVVGVGVSMPWSLRLAQLGIDTHTVLTRALGAPFLCAAPLLAWCAFGAHRVDTAEAVALTCAAALATGGLMWRVCLTSADRARAAAMVPGRRRG